MNHVERYLSKISDEGHKSAILDSVKLFDEKVLSSFDWLSTRKGLLYGDVQSGKTSHVLGMMAHAMDSGFQRIVFLTSDNTRLAEQTFSRAVAAFPMAEVCQSTDEQRFRAVSAAGDRPIVIVLTKNQSVLRKWKRRLSSDGLHGVPILIIDDEADAGSLNNAVNSKKQERTQINKLLTEIRDTSSACIYLQVTGTPQAVILQTTVGEWRPDFLLSFEAGDSYIGGESLFSEMPNPHVRGFAKTSSNDAELRRAVINYLVTCALMRTEGDTVCNMLVHPSRRKEEHSGTESEINDFIQNFRRNLDTDEVFYELSKIWIEDFQPLGQSNKSAEEVVALLREFLDLETIDTFIVNSENKVEDNDPFESGYNIIIGGDSLGRGLTIPALQTVFYSRDTKMPQADTLWQHARMFGYDRKLEYLRIFMPSNIAKNFSEVHKGNEAIKSQLRDGTSIDDFQIDLDPSIKPTRRTVLDFNSLSTLVGGVNYFAFDPVVRDIGRLDSHISRVYENFDEDYRVLPLKSIISLLKEIEAEEPHFSITKFVHILNGIVNENPAAKGNLIVRRSRKVSQGKGTLLSPNDRELVDQLGDATVLVLYRVEGDLGWSSNPIWVPNIKLPGKRVYYRIEET